MLAVLLICGYVLGLWFSLGTHKEEFATIGKGEPHGEPLPIGPSLVTLAVVTILVALVSHIFVASVEVAGKEMGLSPAFVGFVVVSLVGGAAEFVSAFSAARKDRLDLSVSIALGSAAQIALFVAPLLVLLSYAVGPRPMGLDFWPGAIVMMLIAAVSATMLTNSGRSTWFLGVLVLMVYAIFGLTLYILPPVQ
jgi:Ca2+:H+ antiporter